MKMEAYANLLSQNNKPFSPTYNSTAFSLRLIASHSFGGGDGSLPSSLTPSVLALIGGRENDRKEVWCRCRCGLDGKLGSVVVNCLVMENMVLVAYSVEVKLKDEARS
nr:hypothetical protein Iba_chr11aCG1000 [Ipomoea batatas]